jgi:glycine cleavage system H protein
MVALFVVGTFVLLIVADGVVQWNRARREKQAEEGVPQPWAQRHPILAAESVSAPMGVYLDKGHTWVGVEPSGLACIGADAFTQRVMGEIDGVELPKPGQEVKRGERLFTLRQGKRLAHFLAPLDGTVGLVNEVLAGDPGRVPADPYHRGWICKLKPSNLAAGVRSLFFAEEVTSWLDQEVARFQDFFESRGMSHSTLGQVAQDGGELTGGVLGLMDDESWTQFAREFLGGCSVLKPET